MSDDYERVLLVKNEVFVYRIPPIQSNRGARAADWKLDAPDWVGRLKVVAKSKALTLKLEDKASGELFAQAPIDKYPGSSIESVLDSSRYFVVRLQDEQGRNAFIGMGFAERGDSFDLNVTLQDFFKGVERDAQTSSLTAQNLAEQPKLDLAFKSGQTITLNIGNNNSGAEKIGRPKSGKSPSNGVGAFPLLPPPPGPGASVRLKDPTGGRSGGTGNPFLGSPDTPPCEVAIGGSETGVPVASGQNPFLTGEPNSRPMVSAATTQPQQSSNNVNLLGNLLDL